MGNFTKLMYDDTEEIPILHKTTPLDITPSIHSISDLVGETTNEHSEYTHPQRDLGHLQKHIQQLQERLDQIGSTTSPSAQAERS